MAAERTVADLCEEVDAGARMLIAWRRGQGLFFPRRPDLVSETIAKSVAGSSLLRYLDLTAQQLEDQGVVALAEGLAANKSVDWLSLRDNHLTGKCIPALTASLCKRKVMMSQLNIGSNELIRDDIQLLRDALPFIENLEMEQCGATWVGLRALGTADESKLTSLSANSNNLDGLQLDGCSALRGLTIIDLSYGNLTASGCPLLCDGLVALAHLARVDVSYNVLREGCQEFARLVPACTQLFVLAMKQVGMDDASGQALARAAGATGRDVKLDFADNPLGDASVAAMLDAMMENADLEVRLQPGLDEELVSFHVLDRVDAVEQLSLQSRRTIQTMIRGYRTGCLFLDEAEEVAEAIANDEFRRCAIAAFGEFHLRVLLTFGADTCVAGDPDMMWILDRCPEFAPLFWAMPADASDSEYDVAVNAERAAAA